MVRRWRAGLAALTAVVWPGIVHAQVPRAAADAALARAPVKRAQAVHLRGAPPRIDGRIDDEVWRQAAFFSDFIQKEPVEGAMPSESTTVGILYDDEFLYIAARMYADSTDPIQRNVSRRDQGAVQSEHIWFSFDSYLDHRTAWSFGVTAAGVRIDWYHPADNEYNLDTSFDPVYDARAHVDSLGWTAELRIPFSQLRFRRQDEQVWGFNVDRWIPSKFEDDFWRPVPKNVTGWASYMGELVGISGIRPSRRIEAMPYAASNATVLSNPDPANPFDRTGRSLGVRAGGDLKAGIGPNLTVEATVNPDFGQVEADPAVVNLSAFEVFFDERRPFFIEGRQLLTGDGANYYYSRRIGAPPALSASGDYVDAPGAANILGAAKLTGRMGSGLSIGALAAVTARQWARTYDTATATFDRTQVAPASVYGVLRLRQEFGPNHSTAGLMLTAVRRDLAPGSPLAQLLDRQAVTGGVDWNLRFSRGWYELRGFAGFSTIAGDTGAIAFQQRSSRRYFQRPDQTYAGFDSTRTSLGGYTANVSLSKISGGHWRWGLYAGAESPGLELNDMGRISTADGLTGGASLTYREVRPGRWFYSYAASLSTNAEWNYAGERQFVEPRLDAGLTFHNQMNLNVSAFVTPRSQDERLTRGGPSMGTPWTWVTIAQLSSNFAAKTQWRARVYYERGEFADKVYRLSGALAFRPAPRWLVSATPNYLRSMAPRQYVTAVTDPSATATFGTRYVFSALDQSQWSMQLRLNYAFTPDLTLELYAEPFIASGRFSGHGELPAPRRYDLRVYGQAPGTAVIADSAGTLHVTDGASGFTVSSLDFSTTSFRSNVVLRWEWRRGSTLYLVWQQNRGDTRSQADLVRIPDLFQGLRAAGDNFLAVKATYWLSAH
jgi:hypothetical protein